MMNTYFNKKYVAYGSLNMKAKKKMQYSNDLILKFYRFLLSDYMKIFI